MSEVLHERAYGLVRLSDRREFLAQLMRWALLSPPLLFFLPDNGPAPAFAETKEKSMNLPKPRLEGPVSLEKAIKDRRTVRSFSKRSLDLPEFAQLLWAAQGITEDRGRKRAAPSGGALYPMDIYAAAGQGGVEGLEAGVYHYEPHGHAVELLTRGDFLRALADASLGQTWMARAPINLVITAEYGRICSKYGERGIRYAMMEAGHIGQNIFLQAEALGLKAGIVGAFKDREVTGITGIPDAHEPLLIMPVGHGK